MPIMIGFDYLRDHLSKAGKGNPNHDAQGRFSSGGGGSPNFRDDSALQRGDDERDPGDHKPTRPPQNADEAQSQIQEAHQWGLKNADPDKHSDFVDSMDDLQASLESGKYAPNWEGESFKGGTLKRDLMSIIRKHS